MEREAFYYLDSETGSDGKHHVHVFSCKLKEKLFPIKLGWHENAGKALEKAGRYYAHEKVGLCRKCIEAGSPGKV
ncbi:hypothetical protein [Sinomicrobium soli]|uniref:hypothetical protein n=1 Tax=Sinomicrobium sp. N-1-3-6 TaxID=2219864 RepID=UPI000DCE8674|nr:hypothetical protein [Sinomicrobium sp. N-1-3-6]RAV28631.1 hypothetical protein DN748_11780 [Sinomicrobium sp. N-1-3-6]